MAKAIAFITNYYPPETGAAANRIALMAELFVQQGYNVQVICPLPNYPTGAIFEAYQGKEGLKEVINGVQITRLRVLPTNAPSLWKRFRAMGSFSFSLWWYLRKHRLPERVFIQYSPLVVGVASSFLLRSRKHKILLNVSDLWPLAGKELGNLKQGFLYTILERLERYTYRKADMVLGQSQEILDHIQKIVPEKKTFLYRNFPKFDPPKPATSQTAASFCFVYAGLLGVAQGILDLCQHIELPDGCELHLYGSGAETEVIQEYIKSSGKQIVYKGSLSRKHLHEQLQTYRVGLVPLSRRIYGSVPSKIFEYALLGLPMVYLGGGEGEDLVSAHQLGWIVAPGDYKTLNLLLTTIALEKTSYPKIRERATAAFNAASQFEDLLNRLD